MKSSKTFFTRYTNYFYFFDNFAKWKQFCLYSCNLVTKYFLVSFPLSLVGIMPFKGRHRMSSRQEDVTDIQDETNLPAHAPHLNLTMHPCFKVSSTDCLWGLSKLSYLYFKWSASWFHKSWKNLFLLIVFDLQLEDVTIEKTEDFILFFVV